MSQILKALCKIQLKYCFDSWSSRVRNKHRPTLINFLTFFQGLRPYSGLHRAYFSSINIRYKWGYAYSFRQIFQGLCLFKGLRLFQTLEYMIKKSRDKRGASDTDFFREIQSRIQRQNLRTKVLIQHFDKVLIDDWLTIQSFDKVLILWWK